MQTKPVLLSLAMLTLLMTGIPSARAAIVISSGESVVFNEQFTDNANSWSNVAVVNGTGSAASGKAAIEGGNWTPSLPSDGTGVTSKTTNIPQLDLADGPISFYMNVKVGAVSGGNAAGYSIRLMNSTGFYYTELFIAPGSTSSIAYRNSAGTGTSSNIGTTNGIITSSDAYYTFKITLTDTGTVGDGFGTAETFYYNSVSSSYVSLGSTPSNVINLSTGIFSQLQVFNRNNTGTNDNAYFDQVVIAQAIPEPGILGLLGLGLTIGGGLVRRRVLKKKVPINPQAV